MSSESSFFSRMLLFNYPVHAYLLHFQMLPSTASVILFAIGAGVEVGVGKEGHTVCAHPCVSGYKWVVMDPLQGERAGHCTPYYLLSLPPSVPLPLPG